MKVTGASRSRPQAFAGVYSSSESGGASCSLAAELQPRLLLVSVSVGLQKHLPRRWQPV